MIYIRKELNITMWLKIDTGLRSHEKIWDMADELNIDPSQALGHMICLWSWALEKNSDEQGFITNKPSRIARAAEFTGNPKKFFNVLKKVRFIEVWEDLDQVKLRNWEEYGGTYLKRMRYDRLRKSGKSHDEIKKEDCKHERATLHESSRTMICGQCTLEWKV